METPINTDFNDFNELDDLRQQINELKNKVDRQGRLNEDLIKKSIQSKMKGLHRNISWYLLVLLPLSAIIIWNFIYNHYAWPFIIFTILFFAASFIADYFINRIDVNHMADDLVETTRKLTIMKKNRRRQLLIGYSLLLIWTPWYLYEIYRVQAVPMGVSVTGPFMIAVTIGAAIGGIIGGILGLSFYRKMQRTTDEMLDQINDLTSGE